MAKILVDEAVLIRMAAQFFQARALFDVIEDEVEHEERAYYLANVGRELTQDAAREVEALYNDEGPKHG
ncbi:hypothetical protein [Burkholderia glumae]|uniref:hypothetical protein n=1 Tax=Burkholderia glumae TaxID=337 RepID=UPI00054AC65D|nr:hypothetical protein [Burkholderia glumae]KHJ63128.1 hypothetical protein NCPPB3923_09855 [Burkholderia glumae]